MQTSSSTELRTAESRSMEAKDSVAVAVHDTIVETTTITIREDANGDTVKTSIVTDRYRGRNASGFRVQDSRVMVKMDTVYVEKRDSVLVSNTNLSGETKKRSTLVGALKWVFLIIVGLIVLVIVFKFNKLNF